MNFFLFSITLAFFFTSYITWWSFTRYHKGKCLFSLGCITLILSTMLISACSPGKTKGEVSKEHRSAIKQYDKNKEKSLTEINEISNDIARSIAVGFAVSNNVDESDLKIFTSCFGDMVHSKNKDLTAETVLGWCLTSYSTDKEAFLKSQDMYDYFSLKEQFSSWDGAHVKSVEFIKSSMNDPQSYKHVETKFLVRKTPDDPHLVTLTKFRGSNMFGAIVTNQINLKVNLKTGEVIEVIE